MQRNDSVYFTFYRLPWWTASLVPEHVTEIILIEPPPVWARPDNELLKRVRSDCLPIFSDYQAL